MPFEESFLSFVEILCFSFFDFFGPLNEQWVFGHFFVMDQGGGNAADEVARGELFTGVLVIKKIKV